MHVQYRGLLFPAAVALLAALLASGCGGSGSSGTTGGGNGLTANATLSGNTVNVTAHTDRSDIASVSATVTGAASLVSLVGSGQDWAGSTAVTAQPGTIITIRVTALDSRGNTLGPTQIQVKMGDYGSQPTVTGVVVSREDNSKVMGATITLGSQSTATDGNGRFVITGLLAGTTQEGVVTKSGFSEARFTVNVTTGTADVGTITLTATADLPPPAPVFP